MASDSHELTAPTISPAILELRSKKRLTGWEAGLLFIADSVEVDHGRPALLSAKEYKRLPDKVIGLREGQIYNSLIQTYQTVGYTLQEAHIEALELLRELDALRVLVLVYASEFYERRRDAPDMPRDELFRDLQASFTLRGIGLPHVLEEYPPQIKQRLQKFLAIKITFEELSLLLGIDLTEDLKMRYQQIAENLDYYNELAKLTRKKASILGASLPSFKLQQIKPSRMLSRYYRERLVPMLGDKWWEIMAEGEAEEEVASGQEA